MKLAAIILICFILSGCKPDNTTLTQITDLRQDLCAAEQCSFKATITANYPDECYIFQMNCQSDNSDSLQFQVISPKTICGINGSISQTGANLTFDDQVLIFPVLAGGRASPVCAPYYFINTLRSGYIAGYSQLEDSILIQMNDTYNNDSLQVEIQTDRNLVPISADIYYQNNCILSLEITDFMYE